MAARLLKDPATAGSRIFVGHLQTEDMNRNELEEHFSKYGTVVGSLLNRGFGFVQFDEEQAAQNAIKNENGAMFKGRRIDVKPAKKESGPGNAGGNAGGNTGGGGGGGGFGNDFNNSFGGGNQNFNNSNSFGNDNQFNRGGGGGPGGNNAFNDQDDSFGGSHSNDSFNMNKNNGPPFGGNRQGGLGGQGGGPNRNQNNQNQGGQNQSGRGRGARGGKNRKNRDNSMNDRMGGNNMDDRMSDPFGDRMGGGGMGGGGMGGGGMGGGGMGGGGMGGGGMGGGGMGGGGMGGDRMSGGMGDRIGGGIGDRMGGGMGDRMGGGIGDRIGGGMGDRIGGGLGDRIGGGLGDRMGGINDSMGGGLGSNFRSGLGASLNNSLGGIGSLSSTMGSGLSGGIGSTLGGLSMNSSLGSGLGSSFRDRSPLGRAGRLDDKPLSSWDLGNKSGGSGGPGGPGGPGGRGSFGGGFNDKFNDHKSRFDDFKGPARDVGPSFGPIPPPAPNDYPSIAAEKNDCEIIVVNKALTEYAEIIESRLKKLGLTVDLLFPNEDVPLARGLVNIASRGCLYAIVVAPTNKEHHSLTLNILHGLPQEHRNMPVDDAINLIMRDFNNYKSGGRSVPANVSSAVERHPDAIQVLLNMLADNLQLTVLQYERVIKYLEMKREEQVQFELGEDAKNLGPTSLVSDPKQAELQSRILNILNSNKSNAPTTSTTTLTTAAPSPVPPPVSANVSANSSVSTSNTVTPSPLLNDPTVQKALDSLLQGNLLKNIGDQPAPAATATPLFAAFPNMNRY